MVELRRVLWNGGRIVEEQTQAKTAFLGGEWRRRRERERGWHIFVWSSLARACHPPTHQPRVGRTGTSAKQGRWEQKQAVPADLGWIGPRPTRGLLARGPRVDCIVIIDMAGGRGARRAGEARRAAGVAVQDSA